MNQNDETSAPAQPRWQLLDKLQRRVLGVLVGKGENDAGKLSSFAQCAGGRLQSKE